MGSGAQLRVYTGGDFVRKITDPRSISGGGVMCMVQMFRFLSRTQKCATLSFAEADYVGMATGSNKTGGMLGNLLSRIVMLAYHGRRGQQGGGTFEESPMPTPNSMHIDVRRHHVVREDATRGEFKVVHVPSAEHAGFLTKPMHTEGFRIHHGFVMKLW